MTASDSVESNSLFRTVLLAPVSRLGRAAIRVVEQAGRLAIFFVTCLSRLVYWPFPVAEVIKQMHFIGARSLPVIAVAGLFTGMVVALQFYDALIRFGSVDLLGSVVALSLIRELGPVMAALMVIARAGSATCSEIAIMRNEQQFDALDCMAIDSFRYVMLPRLIAGIIAVPLLTAIVNVVGIGGGYIVGVIIQGVSDGAYLGGMADTVLWSDVRMGLVKSTLFGAVIFCVVLAKGYYVHIEQPVSGAEGVGRATTDAVVLSAMLMLFTDYVVSALML
ncbi:MlaE family ABC transporter permease [Exilibacterium tricleocarpae]|uniref:MlaE family ABC transporter permease n=1 Tax=Exilibacterium tricleocarpae TaxID=2591008 RepID=UPI0015D0F43C|nr:ABC transporter permease [Exilibacterium tricleocarpae]